MENDEPFYVKIHDAISILPSTEWGWLRYNYHGAIAFGHLGAIMEANHWTQRQLMKWFHDHRRAHPEVRWTYRRKENFQGMVKLRGGERVR